jgi:hypothetical protein
MSDDEDDPWHFREKRKLDPYLANKTIIGRGKASGYHVSNDMTAEEFQAHVKRQFESLPMETREQWQDRRFTADTSNYDLPAPRVITIYESPPVKNTLLGCRRRW